MFRPNTLGQQQAFSLSGQQPLGCAMQGPHKRRAASTLCHGLMLLSKRPGQVAEKKRRQQHTPHCAGMMYVLSRQVATKGGAAYDVYKSSNSTPLG
jgi:hypothetical protein